MKSISGLAAVAASLALMAGLSGASAGMSYQVTVTNNMDKELLAPILVAPATDDGKIFAGEYVSKEAEHQILTGDPGMLAKAIGTSASVGHGKDGPPGVLLAPGKSVSFAVTTDAKQLRVIAMVAPTMYKDHYVTALVDLDGKAMSVALDRFDIGHDEKRMTIAPIAKSVATVSIGAK